MKEAIIQGTALVIMTVFGIVANSITFLTIFTTKTLRENRFNLIIMSLCVSDLLSSISCPFTAYGLYASLTTYPFPSIVCKLHSAIDFWTNAVTIQHILVFSVLRLFSIVCPHKINKITYFNAKVTVAIMWIETAVVAFLPYFLVMGVYRSLFDGWACIPNSKWIMTFMVYVEYSYPVILYLPMTAVSLCSLLLVMLMVKRKYKVDKRNTKEGHSKENKAILQLTLILFSFLLGYVPDVVRRLYNARNSLSDRKSFLFYIIPITTLRFSECLNPIFYNIASSSIRQATKKFLCPKRKTSNSDARQNSAVTKQTNDMIQLQSIPSV